MEVRQYVCKLEKYDAGWPDSNIIEFSEWLEEKVNSIPERFRETAKIEIDSTVRDEDDSRTCIKIYYYRPETEGELEIREIRRKARYEASVKADLEQLKLLKFKYEGVPLEEK